MAAKRTWAVWVPSTIRTVDRTDGAVAHISGHVDLGRIFERAGFIGDVTREEAESIARQRHGDDVIVARHRGGSKPATKLYERDLRPNA